jgi:hypothetical protein
MGTSAMKHSWHHWFYPKTQFPFLEENEWIEKQSFQKKFPAFLG